MHHGTLLFDSNAEVLSQALRVDPEKIKSKGVKSVRSRVTNIRPYLPTDMELPQFRKLLLESILEQFPGKPYVLTPEDLAVIGQLKCQRYDTWDWNYGHSPECTVHKRRRIEGCGTVEVYLTLKQGLVEGISFRGDFFSTEDPAALAQMLRGCRPTREAYTAALEGIDVSRYFMGLTLDGLLSILE